MAAPGPEPHEHRLKRLYMRSIRRGIKEMDILLTRFADARLSGLEENELVLYDALLSENDQDLYQWVTGQASPPAHYTALVAEIARVSSAAAP
ncbi:MAG: succinate dehydrogenase assembly factor 2 [Gammaproteobacteria bacterium]